MRLLLIDNYDSFTYNLVQYFGELGATIEVRLHDQVTLTEIAALAPNYLVISPGPGSPKEAGVSVEVIQKFAGKIPILGVCLGHQCIATAFGGSIVRALQPMHGKISAIQHHQQGLFAGLANPLQVTRYHSLIVERTNLPSCLEITATSSEGEIMALQHRDFANLVGVQFHPEAILTEGGKTLLANFLATG